MKACIAIVLVSFVLFVGGCAEIDVPRTDDVLRTPLGNAGLVKGMSKSEVVAMYGEPDIKDMVTSDDWNETREEWFYRGRYGSLPVNAGYLADDMYLYFDGNNLTNISKKPLGSRVQGAADNAK